MIDRPVKERRVSPRYQLAAGVQFFHGPSGRNLPARCVDISRGGLLMYVPAASPVQPGQTIRLTLGAISLPKLAGLSGAPIGGTIVRVDRRALLAEGCLAVGVRFAQA
jgi:c-di-GMP-binding flagellar brake protein YcgR